MLYYIDEATEVDFEDARNNPKSPQNYFYKYVPYEKMLDEDSKNSLFFIHPELWNDPWESLVLTGKFKIARGKVSDYPLAEKVLATCFTSNYSSEAQWHIYEQNEPRIMLSYNKTKLVDALMQSEGQFFVGKVRYDTAQSQIIKAIEDLAKKSISYFEDSPDISQYSIETQKNLLEPLLIKRMPFGYEQEYRFFMLDDSGTEKKAVSIPNLSNAIGQVTLSPIESSLSYEEQKEELHKYGFSKICVSSLYKKKVETQFNLMEK